MPIVYDESMQEATDLHDRRDGQPRHKSWILESVLLIGLLLMVVLTIPSFLRHQFLQVLVRQGARVEYVMMEYAWFEEFFGSEPPEMFRSVVVLDLSETHGITDQQLQGIKRLNRLEIFALMNSDVSAQTLMELAQMPQLRQLSVRNCPNIKVQDIRELQSKASQLLVDYRSTAYLGVYGTVTENNACVITTVDRGSSADIAGLKAGDIVKTFNGIEVRDFSHLVELLWTHNAGDALVLLVEREGVEMEFRFQVGAWG